MKRNAKSKSKFLNALLLCIAFVFLLIGAGLAVNNVLAQYHSTEKTLIPVTEDIRESIYKENKYFKDLPYLDGDFLSYTDFKISDKTAEHVTKLSVNMQRTDSLSMLNNLPLLQTIDIYNAEYLSPGDIQWLDVSSVETIRCWFNSFTFTDLHASFPDFSLLKHKKASIMTNSQLADELYLYHFFLMTDGFRQNISCPWFNEETFLAIDEKIDEILASPLGIDHYRSPKERIIKIVLAVCQYLEYDPDVAMETKKDRSEWNPDIAKRISDYDKHPLTTSLIGDLAGKGTCVSFSYAFAAACMKMGIDAYEVSGYGSSKDTLHSWNRVRINDEDIPIDPTAIYNSVSDEWNIYHDYLEEYEEKAARGIYEDDIMDTFCDVILVNYPKKMEKDYDTTMNRVLLFLPRKGYLAARRVPMYYNSSGNLHIYNVNYEDALVSYALYGILPAAVCIVIYVLSKKKTIKGVGGK